MPLLLAGCNSALLDPKGAIGLQQKELIITATWLMLIVVVPVILMTVWFAWHYRSSNKKATYAPDWHHSTKLEFIVWTIPCIIILILGAITWKTTHSLEPSVPIESKEKPLVIQAISLDWKWLFIYPEQGIATINEISIPTDVPVEFKITSDTVMNSFFIPQLGSQIYAMAGMETNLNLISNHDGTYKGISSNYSGHGFSDMKFNTYSTSKEKFAEWVAKVKSSPKPLMWADFEQLEKQSINAPVQYFGTVKPGLYQDLIHKYMGDMNHAQKGEMPMNHSMPHDANQADMHHDEQHMNHDMSGHEMNMSEHSGSGE